MNVRNYTAKDKIRGVAGAADGTSRAMDKARCLC